MKRLLRLLGSVRLVRQSWPFPCWELTDGDGFGVKVWPWDDPTMGDPNREVGL